MDLDTLPQPGTEAALETIETLLDGVEDEEDDSVEMDQLIELSENPLDLNNASAQQLACIPGVTFADALRVVRYREESGGFSSLARVTLVAGSGDSLASVMKPFVYVRSKASRHPGRKRAAVRLRSRFTRDLQPRAGYSEGRFSGSSLKSYNRFLLVGGENLQMGLLAEKDAGERFPDGFFAAFVRFAPSPALPEVLLGDFVLDAAQGLVFSRATRANKSFIISGDGSKRATGLRGYASTDEVNFLRGAALTQEVSFGQTFLRAAVVASRRSLSASIGDGAKVTSFYRDGLFRTTTELSKRDAVDEELQGGRLVLTSTKGWETGISFCRCKYSREAVLNPVSGLTARAVSVVGIDGRLSAGPIGLFTEVASSGHSSIACILGGAIPLSGQGAASFLYRYYSPEFANPHAQGIGERDGTRNERGFVLGVRLRLSGWLRLNTYVDVFGFPWPTATGPFPATGRETYVEVSASAFPALDFSLRYSAKDLEQKRSFSDERGRTVSATATWTRQKLRLKVRHQATVHLRLDASLEGIVAGYQQPTTVVRGVAAFQGIRYSTRTLQGEIRMIVFDTDSYFSRLYEYESDLVGVYHNGALYGRGRRWYALVRWSPTGAISLSAKYSETIQDGARSVGSGEMEISGDLDNRLSIQVDLGW